MKESAQKVAALAEDYRSRVASGEETKSEELGFGGAEFVPWAMGAVM
jgi:altronate dehydratase